MDVNFPADPAEISPAALDLPPAPTDARKPTGSPASWLWFIALVLVTLFGYLSPARRAALGAFAAQVADVIRDFKGYDPEF